MTYSVEKISGNKMKISFDVPAEDFDSALQKAYIKTRSRINVPGFRKGKAPRRLIESMYGEGVFYDEAFDLVFPGLYQEAVEKEALNPVDRPEISLDQVGAGKELKFTVEVYVRPEVTLGEYRGLKAVRYLPPVTEESINARIERDVKRATTQVDVTDGPAQAGDSVSIDYAGTLEGEAFEGGSDAGHRLTLGAGAFIPGFEEQLIGMRPGEEKDITVTFPAGYHNESLAGREAAFHVKLNEAARDLRPELDDEFAADVSEHNTFAAYREAIVRELEELRDRQAEAKLENSLIMQAVDAADCDIPGVMIEDEIDAMIRSLRLRLAYQGLKYDDYLKYMGMTEEQVRDRYRADASVRVKTELVLGEIGKKEGVAPSEEEIDSKIAEGAAERGKDAQEYKAGLNEAQLKYFAQTASIAKVVGILKEAAAVTVKETEEPAVPAGELIEAVDEALLKTGGGIE